ncbi:MAG: NAD(FAD)-utilizing dehydrogenase [Anaerovoracaceae bacterium]
MYRIHQIKLNIDEPKDRIQSKIIKKIGYKDMIITDYNIVKESIDARDKSNIKWVYTVDFNCATLHNPKKYLNLAANPKLNLEIAPNMSYKEVEQGSIQLENRPVIVGFGPCGMFAGLLLATRGYKPLIIERGNMVEQRVKDVKEFWDKAILNPESNVQFGEGGAGTFSDGKLTTGIKDSRIRKVLEEFVVAGADPDILYKQKPHIGTDVLQQVVANIRKTIISYGGEIRFGTRLDDIIVKKKKIIGVKVSTDQVDMRDESDQVDEPKEINGEGRLVEEIPTENLILAIGHSARDTFRMLFEKGIAMEQKPFSIGVRVEHPQKLIDQSQYGNIKALPPADYKLSYHCQNGRGVYTFCMCPGGIVIGAASQIGGVVTNGMSNRKRNSGVANSALLCDVKTTDFNSVHPLAGVFFQEKYEKLAFESGGGTYKLPKTTWKNFRDNNQDAQPVINSLPEFAVESIREAMPHMGKYLQGFDGDDVVMTAVETRSSSPVKFDRGDQCQGTFEGLYPGGEGAGYAGGIMSASCDGIKIAEKIIGKYKPFI